MRFCGFLYPSNTPPPRHTLPRRSTPSCRFCTTSHDSVHCSTALHGCQGLSEEDERLQPGSRGTLPCHEFILSTAGRFSFFPTHTQGRCPANRPALPARGFFLNCMMQGGGLAAPRPPSNRSCALAPSFCSPCRATSALADGTSTRWHGWFAFFFPSTCWSDNRPEGTCQASLHSSPGCLLVAFR